MSHLYFKTIILPRQARDKHRKNSKKKTFCAGRLVYARIKLGLLDPPDGNPYTKIPRSAANSAENRGLAVRTAQEGVVLLTNAKKTLPLSASAFRRGGAAGSSKLAVVGPNSVRNKHAFFEPFIYKNDLFTKTGSGQT